MLGHRPALDGVRAMAILLVLGVHTLYLLIPKYQGRFLPGGFIGVDIFFVLSGFLITCLLLEEWQRQHRISMRNFYRRRALRLFPALWAVMAVQLGYTLLEHDPLRSDLKGLAAIFFYFGNWSWKFGAVIPANMAQTWSLAVEEQFYLVWPLLMVALLRAANRRVMPAVMAGLIAVGFCSRLALWHLGVPWTEVGVQTEVRLDALMIGAMLAYLLKSGWRPGRRIELYGWVGTGCIAVVALTTRRESGWLFDGGYTVVALAAVLAICAALDDQRPLGRILSLGPLQVIGRLSYSLYLWHMLIFTAVERAWPTRPSVERLAVGWGLTAIASVVSYHVIELPFLRRKGPRTSDFATPDSLGGNSKPSGAEPTDGPGAQPAKGHRSDRAPSTGRP